MGMRIIKQDDGKFGLFSTVSDRIIAIDCDEAEMVQIRIVPPNVPRRK